VTLVWDSPDFKNLPNFPRSLINFMYICVFQVALNFVFVFFKGQFQDDIRVY